MTTATPIPTSTLDKILTAQIAVAWAGEGGENWPPIPDLVAIPAGAFWSGSDRAERELGFRARTSVAEGVEPFVRWFREESGLSRNARRRRTRSDPGGSV